MRYPSPTVSAVPGHSKTEKNPATGTSAAPPISPKFSFKESLHQAEKDSKSNVPLRDDEEQDDLSSTHPSLAPWAAVSQMFSEHRTAPRAVSGHARLTGLSVSPALANKQVDSAAASHHGDQSKSPSGSNGTAATVSENRGQKNQASLEQTGPPQAQIAVPFATFAQRLESPALTRTQISDIAQSVMDKVRVIKEGEAIRVEMTLQPEDLGKMSLSIKMQRGVISISLLASPEAKQILDPGVADIVALLQQQGVTIGGFSVSTNSQQQGQASSHPDDGSFSVGSAAVIAEKKEPVLPFTLQNSEYILTQNFGGQNQSTVSVET